MKAKEKLSRVGISYFFFNGISFSLIGILEIFDFLRRWSLQWRCWSPFKLESPKRLWIKNQHWFMNIFHLTFKCHHWDESYSKASCWSFRATLIILLILCQFPLVWFSVITESELLLSVQFSSVTQSCPTLCDPWTAARQASLSTTNSQSSTQTHIHRVSDAIQPSHPLSSPSPPALNLSQHQGLFKWVSSSHQMAKVLEFQLQHQSFQWTPWTDLL